MRRPDWEQFLISQAAAKKKGGIKNEETDLEGQRTDSALIANVASLESVAEGGAGQDG